MRSLVVIEFEVGGQTGVQLRHGAILVETDAPVFDAAPETFVEDVVEGAAVHDDLNVRCKQGGRKTITRPTGLHTQTLLT